MAPSAANPIRGGGSLLLSESSRGSSSAHEAHVPRARGRRRLQAANATATSPGRVLTGFRKANELLTQTSWLLLFRRMRLLLKGKSFDGCSNPWDRLIRPPVNEPERYPVRPRGFRAESLDGGHSHRLRTFRSLVDLELDSLIFLKGAKTVPLDLRMVDENVFCAPVRGDKSETFFAAEPFHSSLCHTNFSLFKWM